MHILGFLFTTLKKKPRILTHSGTMVFENDLWKNEGFAPVLHILYFYNIFKRIPILIP